MPRKISTTKFKDQCLSPIDQIGPEGVVITKNGKAIAKLLPISNGISGFIGSMKGRLEIIGDIQSTGLML
jgi:hypothetical protein